MSKQGIAALFGLLTGVMLLNGCSFSTSSESSSDSSKSLIDLASSPKSFSTSSGSSSKDKLEKYENEVARYTAEFVTSSDADLAEFRQHLSQLAEQNGVSNWHDDYHTYVGIGRGFKKAELNKPQISAFTESLAGSDSMKKQAIEEGLKK